MASKSWKEELDEKLSRLHSLLFGMEAACDRQEWEKALGLGLCLLGFLSSQCRTEEDRVYVEPIRKRVQRQIDMAKGHQYKLVEHKAFLAADLKPGLAAFRTSRPVDVEKIKNSRFFKPFVSQTDAVAPSSHIKAPSVDSSNNRKRQLHPASAAAAKSSVASDWRLLNKPRFPAVQRREEEDKDVRKKPTGSDAVNEERHSKGKALGYASESAKRKREVSDPGLDTKEQDDMDLEMQDATMPTGFVTAKQKWAVDSNTKGRLGGSQNAGNGMNSRTTLGVSRRNARGGFVPPFRGNAGGMATSMGEQAISDSTCKCLELLAGPDGELPDKLRNLEPRLLEHISNEIMEKDSNVRWDDIAGLDYAKKCVTEMVIWPLLRPDLFHGCRSPEKGLLLFGPPGTGKTMIGKAIANEAKATFFSISASSLTSKWIGEGEKLVRALFGVATCRQPAVIFIDEVDSLLSQRKSEGEHESSRRIKTQFLIEMEGIGSGNEQLLLIGATNRPQELDEAARRRFSKRLYIPLPCADARAWIVRNLLRKDGLLSLSDNDVEAICSSTEGYSGSDMKNLVKEASMWPLREALNEGKDISKLNSEEMRPISLEQVRPSVSKGELGAYEEWNRQFGSLSFTLN